jgi:hypothetical protein
VQPIAGSYSLTQHFVNTVQLPVGCTPHYPDAFHPTGVNGLRMLGILHDAVVFLIEQLSGAKHCRNYKFRFHKPEEANEPPLNPHGSARAEVHLRQAPFFSLSSLGSQFFYPMLVIFLLTL